MHVMHAEISHVGYAWRCEKKDKIPHRDWHWPEFAPKSGDSSKSGTKVENHTCIAEENHSTVVEISCAKKVFFKEPPEEIFDSGSTITLSKSDESMSNVRNVERNVIMSTNAAPKG